MPVSTLAEAMAIDAYARYTGPKSQGDESSVIIENSDIYRIVEVCNNKMIKKILLSLLMYD